MKEILQNQIALALLVFTIIVIGAYVTMGAEAKDVVIQVITAIGALVTGVAVERSKNQRATDTKKGE